jgi:hypothetical protein
MEKRRLLYPAITLVLITIIFGTIYVIEQQSLRISANSPQIQIAEDAAVALNNGTNPVSFANNRIDIGQSLSPFIIIYNKSGNVVSGDGYLNNKIPKPPLGVLKQSKNKDYNFVTWQPQGNVRVASVSVSARNYYVLSGRSLKEVEKQEQSQLQFAEFAWAVSVVVLIIEVLIDKKMHNKRARKNRNDQTPSY